MFYNTQPAINLSLEMCQKLHNPEALDIIGVEVIISQKSYLASELPSRLLFIARTILHCQESSKIGQPKLRFQPVSYH